MPACHAGDRRFESGRVRHPHFPTPRPPARTGRTFCPRPRCPTPPAADLRRLCHTPARDPTPHPDRDRPAPRRRRGGGRRRSVRTRRWRGAGRIADRLDIRGRSRDRPDDDADERPARCRCLGQPVADRRADPGHARRHRRRADRAGHELPIDGHERHGQGCRCGPRRHEQPLRRARPRRRRGARDPRRARRRRCRSCPHRHVRRRAGPRRGPRQEPQAARLPAGGRGRAGGARPGLGRQGAVRGRSGQEARRLAADRAAARAGGGRGVRPGDHLDPVRRRRHPARSRRLPDAQVEGCELRLRWRDGRHHRSLQGLLVDGLGPAVHEADRECRRLPAPDQERRHRRRQLREPGAGQAALPRVRDQLLGRSPLHRRPRRRRDRLPVRWPTTTSATRAGPACSRRSRT